MLSHRVLATSVLGSSLALASTALAQQPPAKPAPEQPVPTVDLTAAVPGGITAEQVGTRAAQTSYQAKAAQYNLEGASARVDQAGVGYIPRVGLTARYTRLSDFTPPSLGGSSQGSRTGTPPPPSTTTPPTALPPGTPLFPIALDFSFPLVLDNYLTQATIAVPISD